MKEVFVDPRIRDSYNDLISLDRDFRHNLRIKLESIKIREQNGKSFQIKIIDLNSNAYLLSIEIRAYNILIVNLQSMIPIDPI